MIWRVKHVTTPFDKETHTIRWHIPRMESVSKNGGVRIHHTATVNAKVKANLGENENEIWNCARVDWKTVCDQGTTEDKHNCIPEGCDTNMDGMPDDNRNPPHEEICSGNPYDRCLPPDTIEYCYHTKWMRAGGQGLVGASACDVVLRLRSKPIIWKTNDKQIVAVGVNI
jgi:hypothetical protein